jgi:phosphoenolpyruvate carboxykinase (GTP)
MDTIKSNTIFTNVAATPDGERRWEEKVEESRRCVVGGHDQGETSPLDRLARESVDTTINCEGCSPQFKIYRPFFSMPCHRPCLGGSCWWEMTSLMIHSSHKVFQSPLSSLVEGVNRWHTKALNLYRRSSVVPLVYQALNWEHGIYVGASVSSEQTSAAEGKV